MHGSDGQHEKAWNDPPLFSLDQMSRPNTQTTAQRRNRYPQMASTADPQSGPMFGATGHTTGQHMHTNAMNMNPSVAANTGVGSVDVNAFVMAVHSTISLVANLPQELVHKWHSIQSAVYGLQMDGQTALTLQSLQTSLQRQDWNGARLYAQYMTNNSVDTIRTVGLTLTEIFRYLP